MNDNENAKIRIKAWKLVFVVLVCGIIGYSRGRHDGVGITRDEAYFGLVIVCVLLTAIGAFTKAVITEFRDDGRIIVRPWQLVVGGLVCGIFGYSKGHPEGLSSEYGLLNTTRKIGNAITERPELLSDIGLLPVFGLIFVFMIYAGVASIILRILGPIFGSYLRDWLES